MSVNAGSEVAPPASTIATAAATTARRAACALVAAPARAGIDGAECAAAGPVALACLAEVPWLIERRIVVVAEPVVRSRV